MRRCNISGKRLKIISLWIIALPLLASFASAELVDEESLYERIEELSSEVESLLETIESQADEFSRIKIRGNVKVRLRDTTHSNVPDPMGPYGEALIKGLKLNHRMILEIEARISEKLTAGGMLRLSNENEIVFDTGPERLSSDRGSVFVRYNLRDFGWTMGYYDVHFSPLTLMRWDMDDNPEGGGTSRCAVCPSEGGAVTAESLEELGPDLTFEGSKMDANLWNNLNVVALFARPRIAQERETYEQYLYGTNVKLRSYHKPSTSFRWLGLTAIYITDDDESVENPSRILYFPIDNKVYGVDFNLPLGNPLLLKGELAYSRFLEKKIEIQDEEKNGNAILMSALLKYPQRLSTGVSYLRISPEYKSIYNALSYSSNNHGFRISSSYDIIRDNLSVWVFYKWLRELESTVKDVPDLLRSSSTASFGITARIFRDLRIQTSYILKSSQRDGGADTDAVDALMRNVNVEFTYDLSHESNVSIKYQYVRHRDKINSEFDHHANITSVLVSTKF